MLGRSGLSELRQSLIHPPLPEGLSTRRLRLARLRRGGVEPRLPGRLHLLHLLRPGELHLAAVPLPPAAMALLLPAIRPAGALLQLPAGAPQEAGLPR